MEDKGDYIMVESSHYEELLDCSTRLDVLGDFAKHNPKMTLVDALVICGMSKVADAVKEHERKEEEELHKWFMEREGRKNEDSEGTTE